MAFSTSHVTMSLWLQKSVTLIASTLEHDPQDPSTFAILMQLVYGKSIDVVH